MTSTCDDIAWLYRMTCDARSDGIWQSMWRYFWLMFRVMILTIIHTSSSSLSRLTVLPRHSSNSSQLSDCSMYGTMSQANGQGFMETHGEMNLAIGVMKWSYMGRTKSSKSVRICSDLPSTSIIIWLGNIMTCGWKRRKHAKSLIKNRVWRFLEGCLIREIWASLVQLLEPMVWLGMSSVIILVPDFVTWPTPPSRNMGVIVQAVVCPIVADDLIAGHPGN